MVASSDSSSSSGGRNNIPLPKRPRNLVPSSSTTFAMLETIKGQEEKQQNATKSNVTPIATPSKPSVAVLDTHLLDCSICIQPLRSPVFQCQNGHLVCASCYKKILNKCLTCSLPVGSNRCRAIERIVESATISCMYTKHGCIEKLSYLKKLDHEKSCIYVPISCPQHGCEYVGVPKCVYTHFAEKHSSGSRHFTFNITKKFRMVLEGGHQLLQEEDEKILFVFHRVGDPLGSFVSVTCVAPTVSDMKFSFGITVKRQDKSISVISPVELTLECFEQPPKEKCILVRNDFHLLGAGFKVLSLELVIQKVIN